MTSERGPVHGLVAHSLGASAATLAMAAGLAVERAIFLAPATDPEQYTAKFARTLRISSPVRDSMKLRIERRYGVEWKSFDLVVRAAAMQARLLVFHDRGDKKLPFSNGAAIATAWPGAELVATRGLGHHKIVRDPGVIFRAVDFLSRPAAAAAADPVVASVDAGGI